MTTRDDILRVLKADRDSGPAGWPARWLTCAEITDRIEDGRRPDRRGIANTLRSLARHGDHVEAMYSESTGQGIYRFMPTEYAEEG